MSVVFTGDSDFRVAINFVSLYSDSTPMVKSDQWDEIVRNARTMVLRADSMQEFVVGMFLADSVWESGGQLDQLVIPYLPGARQDRVNPTGDVLFTAKSVARMINQRGFKRVLSVDPHSPVMPGLIHHFEEYPLELVAQRLHQGYTGIIAPDKGAKDRAEHVAHAMNKPVFYGSKVRDVSTGRLTGFELEGLPEGGHFLVVDDICDGGGTFLGLGEKIKEQGCYADLFVTHGIFSKGTDALKEIYRNIYTTDTRDHHERNIVSRIRIVEEMENY